MVMLRNVERTLETLKALYPEYGKELLRAVGARGNIQPYRRRKVAGRKGQRR